MLAPWKKSYEKPRQNIKKQRHYFADKDPSSQSYSFPCSHVWMWELDHKEGGVLKNWCFWTVVLEKTLENLLDCKEIKPVNLKGNQPWILTGRIDAEAEALATWCEELTHLKRPWCWERLKAGREGDDRGWDGWMTSPTHGHDFEQALGAGEGQVSLACCSPWGSQRVDTAELLNNNNLFSSQVGRDRLSMSWTKAFQFTVKQRGRVLWVKLLSLIIITK